MNATTLREMLGKAITHLIATGPDHDDGCPEDDTCNCETGQGLMAVDKCVNLFGPLLDVLEAAEKDVEDRPAPKSKRQIGLELAIAALYRRAGEVMG